MKFISLFSLNFNIVFKKNNSVSDTMLESFQSFFKSSKHFFEHHGFETIRYVISKIMPVVWLYLSFLLPAT